MIDFENEDLGKFPESMIVNFLCELEKFSSLHSKCKFVNWCLEHFRYELLARIALIDFKK